MGEGTPRSFRANSRPNVGQAGSLSGGGRFRNRLRLEVLRRYRALLVAIREKIRSRISGFPNLGSQSADAVPTGAVPVLYCRHRPAVHAEFIAGVHPLLAIDQS